MLDKFATADTPVHRRDPAAKVLAAVALVLAVVLVRRDHLWPFVPAAAALAAYHALARLPLGYAARRLAIVSPLALVIAAAFPFLEPGPPAATLQVGPWTLAVTQTGLARAAHLAAKFLLSAYAMLLLLATTRFQDVLQALERLRLPRVFVVQLAFLYRYLWVLVDEGMRLGVARSARDGGAGPWGPGFRSRAAVVGVLFVRTYDRAERIYWAMASRGFDGTLHAAPGRRPGARVAPGDWPRRDAAFLAAAAAVAAAVLILDRALYG
jgi:cobalt/nickel transport system permease protein